jgi:CheY-like chemotaxis protein
VTDLLTLARRGVATHEIVNLNDIIREYLNSPEYDRMKSFYGNVEVKTNMSKNLWNLRGSQVHLAKTIMNLVSNATEAMPDGGSLTITTGNLHLENPIDCYTRIPAGDYTTVTITDTGVGISYEDKERIFEPFYTKKIMGRSGTGLGMAVVWGTIKDHNGYIDLESSEGKGSTFVLYFPATMEKIPENTEIEQSPEMYKGNGESVLVVDDVKEQRDIASMMLTHLGYSVATASNGEEAVEYLKSHKVELLVLDMIMDPGMDGLDTYKQIIQDHPDQKAIITSGFSVTSRVQEAEALGVGAYIKKPYTMEILGIAVRNELHLTAES